MLKFNSLVKADCTYVLINKKWYKVKSVHETRKLIEVYGLGGSFQYGHVTRFTNKEVAA